MSVGDNILDATSEAVIDKNCCLIDNQSSCNAFDNTKYLPNNKDVHYGKYIYFHCNAGVTYTNKIIDLHVYSNPVWYNPKDISNILSLGLVNKHHPVIYNSRYGNDFFFTVHSDRHSRCPRLVFSIITLKTVSKTRKMHPAW